jgi:sulfatase maturation enzyme AslB (radical SAM superfamily)
MSATATAAAPPVHLGVLQIEPTDFCNLRCKMCAPHAESRDHIHGDSPKGFMELDVFKGIIDDIAGSGMRFDHLIFQWLGDPSLHPNLPEMLDYAVTKAKANFGYFRIDTNAIRLSEGYVERLMDVIAKHPHTEILIIFSLDAVTRETYEKVKGVDAFDKVQANVRRFLDLRAQHDLVALRLHFEFQFVLQPDNAHETRLFVDLWRHELEHRRKPGQWDDIMVKRVSTNHLIGLPQDAADALYDRTLRDQGVQNSELDFMAVKVWERTPWREGREERLAA